MYKNNKNILEIINLNKSFPGVSALNDVSFDLNEGEIHCLVGENGAGKTTFIEILSGSIKPDSGEINIFRTKYEYLNPHKAINIGIQTVHQDSYLVESLTVAENIFLSNLKTNKAHFFDLKKCFAESKKLLDSLNFELNPKLLVERLSPVEKKVLSIVRTMWSNVKILILDEPTASLGEKETDILISLVKKISQKGIGVIYISHLLDEVFRLGDRITVLKDGRKIDTHLSNQISKEDLIKEMVGKESKVFYKSEKKKFDKFSLEVKNYSKKGVIKNASFSVSKGEIFGFAGMVGSGRTELMRLIFGLDKKDNGRLFYEGSDITPSSPEKAIKNKIGFLTEDKKETGLILERSVKENITLVKVNNKRTLFLDLLGERKDANDMVKKLRIRTPGINQFVKNLSGGNQQKVVLAKWLLINFDIIILDEPTKGIDVGAKEEIYNIINDMAKQGKIIILISSDLEELIAISHTIGVMKNGEIVKILREKEITQEAVLFYSIGKGKNDE